MIKKLIFTCSFLIALSVAISIISTVSTKLVSSNKNFYISSTTTNNSSLMLTGTTKPGDPIEVFIQKGNQYRAYLFKANSSGKINRQVYFPYGAGEYTISVGESTTLPNQFVVRSMFKAKNTDNRTDLDFLLPDLDIESDDIRIITTAQNITSGLTNDYDKAKAIHDWVAQNIAYDVGQSKKYTAVETLTAKKAICNGYAKLTVALCRAVSIKAKYISGIFPIEDISKDQNIDNHAWTEIYADNRWIIVDTTLDAGYIDEKTQKFKKRFSLKYFDPSAANFAKNHRKIGTTYYSVDLQ